MFKVRKSVGMQLSGLAIMAVLLMTSCTPEQKAALVTITYDQPANCYVWDPDPTATPHSTTGAGNGMFVIYKIASIKTGTMDFNFKVNKLFVADLDQHSGNTGWGGPFETAKDQIIPKNTTKNNLGRIIIYVAGDPQELKDKRLYLSYDVPSNDPEPVAPFSVGPNPKFLDPCTGKPNNIP